MSKHPNVFNINPTVSFVDALADGILKRYEKDSLADITVILPNNRTCRMLSEAFLRQSGKQAILLPKIQAVSEIEDLEEAVTPIKRRLLLADIVEENLPKVNYEQALELAEELGSFLDEVQKDNLSFSDLSKIVPEDLSAHWQSTLDFFQILSKEWPKILEQEGLVDYIEGKKASIDRLINEWKERPPSSPVIAAGSTGSVPYTKKLLKHIAYMDNGVVVLPALDKEIDDDSWEDIEEHHPQYGLKNLISDIGIKRNEIEEWSSKYGSVNRFPLWREVMCPASMVGKKWEELNIDKEALSGLSKIDAANIQEEANIISLILRDGLEEGKESALITSDRRLARTVSSLMKRWGVEADDSAGYPISRTPAAVFMQLVVDMVSSRFSPVAMLAALKHPFAACGMDRVEFITSLREFEEEALRGIRIGDGIEGLIGAIGNKPDLQEWLKKVEKLTSDLSEALNSNQPLRKIINIHKECAEKIASTDKDDGKNILWSGDKGKQLEEYINNVANSISDKKNINGRRYSGIFESLISTEAFRPRYNRKAKVSILSPMEARLINYDLVVLGGMNEGSWPQEDYNIWMSRDMRGDFGLSPLSKKIGLLAHDFIYLACSKEVFITRSEKVDGTSTNPSPWLLRLEAILKGNKLEGILSPQKSWKEWAEQFNAPENKIDIIRPEPKPPLSARPKELSVTRIETLMSNPYAIYAEKILKLKKKDEIDEEPSAREFGNIIHKILEDFISEYKKEDYQDSLNRLLECGKKEFKEKSYKPAIYMLWWPRFEEIARWIVKKEMEDKSYLKQLVIEKSGSIKLNIGEEIFSLTAKADRMEISGGDEVKIIDYKTGTPPSSKSVKNGLSPQLTLEGLILEKGGFEDIENKKLTEAEYWKLSGNDSEAKKIKIEDDVEKAEEGLFKLIEHFYDENNPYLCCPDEKHKPKYDDYAHLARIKEWS